MKCPGQIEEILNTLSSVNLWTRNSTHKNEGKEIIGKIPDFKKIYTLNLCSHRRIIYIYIYSVKVNQKIILKYTYDFFS